MLDRILRAGEGRQTKRFQRVVEEVNGLADAMAALTDAELRARTDILRERVGQGSTLDAIQAEAFALVREAAWRVLGQRPFDVQVFGAAVLHAGNIAEMRTGEGKTLTSTMPVFLNALGGRGVHVVTVNEYLAQRDADWMGRVHRSLGLTVDVVVAGRTREEKQRAYAADVTYGTNNEFGFDYLRDNMVLDRSQQVQRGRNMALVDEVDSILVDEARTPLIISGPAERSADLYRTFARQVVPNMVRGADDSRPGESTGDYVVDEAKRTVAVTEEGVAKVERILGVDNLFESVNTPLIHHLQNALKARDLYRRDREYLVVDGEVRIVDENTGRVLEGRRYSEGLHQAIEAKEGVAIKDENQTLATITLQNYYRLYDKLAGMTGTAKTEEVEFLEIYGLGVVEVPTNRSVVRDDAADLVYKTEAAKYDAVVDEIAACHEDGQPVLVGTTSVEKSELLSGLLRRRGIAHEVLNAKNHAREADIVAQAGRRGAVTVATNMAGRGTDIVLGGNAEVLARRELAKLGPDAGEAAREAALERALERIAPELAAEGEEVKAAGGLMVIGTERHESRRIDNQLRGRSGRQGDPGASRFFLSLEDDLMRLFNAAAVDRIMTRLRIPDDVPIEHALVSRAVANAQRQVESINFDRRKNVLKYDDVMNEQRKVVYDQRQRLLEGDAAFVAELASKYLDDVVVDLVGEHCPEGTFAEDWDLDGLGLRLGAVWDLGLDLASLDLETIEQGELVRLLREDARAARGRREVEVGGPEVLREVERRVILTVIDRKWREHLYEMDALRDGIGLRAVGQRDPLTEYRREAYDSFAEMMSGVKEEAVTYVFRVPVEHVGPGGADQGDVARSVPLGRRATVTTASAAASARAAGAAGGGGEPGTEVRRREDGSTVRAVAAGGTYTSDEQVGRNDPCPCGSGRKFKRCHGSA
ncbi:MAG: preprotein translocase subunit SecA [Actinomycetota bacterium]